MKERDRLFKEVESLKKENEDKESVLKTLDNECSELKEKLDKLEEEQTSSMKVSSCQKVDQIECEICGVAFQTTQKMRMHVENTHAITSLKTKLKIKALETEKLLSELKLDAISKIYKIKSKEAYEKNTCRCKSFCRILPSKHNFKMSKAAQFEERFNLVTNVMLVEGNEENNSLTAITDSVYECETCTDKFQRARDFIMHMENNHQNAAVQFLQ